MDTVISKYINSLNGGIIGVLKINELLTLPNIQRHWHKNRVGIHLVK